MWFLNDISIRKEGLPVNEVIELCKKNGIKIGNAWHGEKWMGRIISDDDYDHLLILIRKRKEVLEARGETEGGT